MENNDIISFFVLWNMRCNWWQNCNFCINNHFITVLKTMNNWNNWKQKCFHYLSEMSSSFVLWIIKITNLVWLLSLDFLKDQKNHHQDLLNERHEFKWLHLITLRTEPKIRSSFHVFPRRTVSLVRKLLWFTANTWRDTVCRIEVSNWILVLGHGNMIEVIPYGLCTENRTIPSCALHLNLRCISSIVKNQIIDQCSQSV